MMLYGNTFFLFCPPVISDAVEEAIARMHHGSHSPQNCSVAHQAGRQHKVTATTTADTNTSHKRHLTLLAR